jgi:hypothetical protein
MHQQTSDQQTSRPSVAMATFVQNKGLLVTGLLLHFDSRFIIKMNK